MDPFDPKKLTLPAKATSRNPINRMPPRHKRGEKFLKGPIPWNWLRKAAHQPGKTFHVAIVVWFLAGICRKKSVRLEKKALRELGLNRHAAYRGLKALEKVGLICVERHPGHSPIVTINDYKNETAPSGQLKNN